MAEAPDTLQASSSSRSIFRKKPVGIDASTEQQEDEKLSRSIGLWQLTAIGVGAIIGAGIFSLAGEVANQDAGPAVTFSFLVAGLVSLAAGLSYAEFASSIPISGSSYTYGYVVLGEVVGWMIGWDLLLEYTAIVAVVAISVSGYFKFLLGQVDIDLPVWMLGAPGTGDGHVVDLFALVLCLFIAFLLTRGISTGAKVEGILVAVKVAIVLLVVVVGVFYIKPQNLTPYFPMGFSGVFSGAAIVFFAVFGYDALSTTAEESKDAQRNLPKAMMISLGISMGLYLLAATVLTGMQHYTKIDPDSAFSVAFKSVGLDQIASVIAVGAVLGIITVMFTFMLAASRIGYSISRDGLLPRWFAKTSKRQVPARVTWILGGAAGLLAGFVDLHVAAELTNIGILLAFVVVCTAVIVMRYRNPNLERGFRCPGMPVVPALGVLGSLWLVSYLPWQTWARFGIWFVLGCILYAAYGYRKSRLHRR